MKDPDPRRLPQAKQLKRKKSTPYSNCKACRKDLSAPAIGPTLIARKLRFDVTTEVHVRGNTQPAIDFKCLGTKAP